MVYHVCKGIQGYEEDIQNSGEHIQNSEEGTHYSEGGSQNSEGGIQNSEGGIQNSENCCWCWGSTQPSLTLTAAALKCLSSHNSIVDSKCGISTAELQ